ncbi:hypothetical protein [Atopomonas sediminilitoris]|uniref:hypothetical protein n=1 Tax=Atopomonas sediminilitoris TaxID=2919919 RepID=UPI001F4EBF89|nr:hypothetical protein [Atopomonas sediminilitoris]MCJ8170574.1 hypothetical protein [Atopomonas sediminilitoris]
MNATTLPSNPPRLWRGRLQLIALFAVAVLPMVLATAMYFGQFWVPGSRSHHGEMLTPGLSLSDLGLVNPAEGEGRWQLLITVPQACDSGCERLLYVSKQIHIGLGREANRAEHHVLIKEVSPQQISQWQATDPKLKITQHALPSDGPQGNASQLWLVDPHGNLVLRYAADTEGKPILNDLRHLLKLSNIG